jgi:MYXO-CTERM domain-containing protein
LAAEARLVGNMRVSVIALIAPLAILASTSRAAATSYFVTPTGDDNAAGTTGVPWKTLQKAAGRVVAGDTVTVADGTYAGFACDGKKGTADARIVFKAANKGGAKITSAGVGANAQDFIQLNSCSYVTVDGFDVSGAPRSGIAILGNTDDGSDARDVIIQNNHSHHNGGTVTAGRHDGIFSGFALNLTIQDNEIHNVTEHGIYVSNAADNPIIRRNHVYDTLVNCAQINADLSTGGDGLISGWLIEGNVMHRCGSAGFNLDGVIQGVMRNNLVYDSMKGGVTLFQGDGAQASNSNLIVNNTIFNPNGSRAALQVASGANNNVVFNNILIAKAVGLEIQTVTGLVHDYNIVSSYSGGAASANEKMADPATLFANMVGRQLALSGASAALDSGVATLGGKAAPAVDIDGRARPAGVSHDRGCYEGGGGGGVVVAPPDAGAPPADAGNRDVATDRGAAGTGAAGMGAVGTGAAGRGAAGTGAAGRGAAGAGAAGTGAGTSGGAGVGGGAGTGGPSSTGVAGAAAGASPGDGSPAVIPDTPGCGCDVGGGQPALMWPVLAGGLLALARRRRR